MVLIPLATFYFLYYVVFDQDKKQLGWCGIMAVIAANGVIASYVVMAWNEPNQGAARTHGNNQTPLNMRKVN